MKPIHLFYTIAFVIAVQFRLSAHAEVVNNDSKEPIDAVQLATVFSQDKPTADAQYRGKQVAVKGVICKIEKGFDTTKKSLASIYLQTAPGLPPVKVDVGNIDKALAQAGKERKNSVNVYGSFIDNNTKTKINVRFVNDVMEARIEVIRTVSIHATGHSSIRTDKQNGEWTPIVKCGDTVVLTGVCKGKLVDLIISDASL